MGSLKLMAFAAGSRALEIWGVRGTDKAGPVWTSGGGCTWSDVRLIMGTELQFEEASVENADKGTDCGEAVEEATTGTCWRRAWEGKDDCWVTVVEELLLLPAWQRLMAEKDCWKHSNTKELLSSKVAEGFIKEGWRECSVNECIRGESPSEELLIKEAWPGKLLGSSELSAFTALLEENLRVLRAPLEGIEDENTHGLSRKWWGEDCGTSDACCKSGNVELFEISAICSINQIKITNLCTRQD